MRLTAKLSIHKATSTGLLAYIVLHLKDVGTEETKLICYLERKKNSEPHLYIT